MSIEAFRSITWVVRWWSRHNDGHIHTNHHEHIDEAEARRDLESCRGCGTILNATLSKVTTEIEIVDALPRIEKAT